LEGEKREGDPELDFLPVVMMKREKRRKGGEGRKTVEGKGPCFRNVFSVLSAISLGGEWGEKRRKRERILGGEEEEKKKLLSFCLLCNAAHDSRGDGGRGGGGGTIREREKKKRYYY